MARHSLDNGSQAQAAGYKNNLFPANHNLGRSGRYHSSACFTTRSLLSIAHLHAIQVTWLNWIFTTWVNSVFNNWSPLQTRVPPLRALVSQSFQSPPYRENAFMLNAFYDTCICCLDCFYGSQGFLFIITRKVSLYIIILIILRFTGLFSVLLITLG